MMVAPVTHNPIVIIKMSSASERELQRTFNHITQLTADNIGQDFVIYDCSDFAPSTRQLKRWVQLQLMGLRGSITDASICTFLVGANTAVAEAIQHIEQETGGTIAVGLYDHMHEAVRHAEEGYRIFSAW